ncbi:MAG TPA: maleylpyruvate isomerase N-terminal domain-containing protein [Galbitalea sp.]
MDFDWLNLQIRAHEEFGRRLEAVTDWHAPTPDTDWDVADLAIHVIREQQWVPLLLDGKTIEEVGDTLDQLDFNDLLGE